MRERRGDTCDYPLLCMIPRKRIDIGWVDLAGGMFGCVMPGDAAGLCVRLEAAWDSRASLACLSVRSGFDALLATLNLPRGSAVLMSAVNIADMARIIEAHGLVAVPVDVDMNTLQVTPAALTRAHAQAPGARACLIAHLFGARMPLREIADFCNKNKLLLLEDCAQAYTGDGWRGAPQADVSMFSFGPVKPATALGGAILSFRDAALCARVRECMAAWPVQTRASYFRRLLKYWAFAPFAHRWPYGMLVALCGLAGVSHDAFVSGAVRGFEGARFFEHIRRRPAAPLLRLLVRRLRRGVEAVTQRRMARGEQLRDLLGAEACVGGGAHERGHWLFAVRYTSHASRETLIAHLAQRGFDATSRASSIGVTPPPAGLLPATHAALALANMVYVPAHEGMSERDIARLADAIHEFAAAKNAAMPSAV